MADNSYSNRYVHDLNWTINNRHRLHGNPNLLLWYEHLYLHQFAGIEDLSGKVILEIGSGASPLKKFYPQVVTSDILELDHLNHVFDCHDIDRFQAISGGSIDIITMTNVLHHLREPLKFLERAASKLAPDGMVIVTEPYFSWFSYVVYSYLHHEPTDFKLSEPVLTNIEGPLSSANIALPQLIFFVRPEWGDILRDVYDFSIKDVTYFSSCSYMMTGGISRKIPLPHSLYLWLLRLDLWLARSFPRQSAAFFTLRLLKKRNSSVE